MVVVAPCQTTERPCYSNQLVVTVMLTTVSVVSIANVLLLSVYLNQLICICYTDVKCHALMRNKETGRYKLGSLKGWRLFPICCPY